MIILYHISGLICRNVYTGGLFCVYVAVFVGSMTWCCGVVSLSDTLLTVFPVCYPPPPFPFPSFALWSALPYTPYYPFLLHSSLLHPALFAPAFSRCKQVHAPLIPAPPGPTHCGAVWGNGGHGTRRGFWIQSIQKRPGSFLAEF